MLPSERRWIVVLSGIGPGGSTEDPRLGGWHRCRINVCTAVSVPAVSDAQRGSTSATCFPAAPPSGVAPAYPVSRRETRRDSFWEAAVSSLPVCPDMGFSVAAVTTSFCPVLSAEEGRLETVLEETRLTPSPTREARVGAVPWERTGVRGGLGPFDPRGSRFGLGTLPRRARLGPGPHRRSGTRGAPPLTYRRPTPPPSVCTSLPLTPEVLNSGGTGAGAGPVYVPKDLGTLGGRS